MLKKEGKSVPPIEIANQILGQVNSPPYIEKVTAVHVHQCWYVCVSCQILSLICASNQPLMLHCLVTS